MIARCQSTSNHSIDRLGDGRPDPLGGGQLLRATPPGSRPSTRTPGQRAGRGRADVPDRERDQHPPQRHRLGPVEVGEQPLAVGGQLRAGPLLTLLGSAGEQRSGQQLRLVEVEQVALVVDHLRVEQGHRGLVAQPLDVEGAAAGDVEDPLAHLRRAVLVVGAAQVLVALLLLGRERCRTPGTRWASPTPAALSGRSARTGPTISGITSPALRSTTVSPGRTSLRFTSWALWRVAFSTVEPATLVGSITPYGVTRPVRPTLTRMSRSLALTSSGGYLNAIAHRGARLVEPSRRCRLDVVDLDHDAVDLVGDDRVAVLAGVLDVGLDVLERRATTRTWSEIGSPHAPGPCRRATAPRARTPRGRRCRGRPCRASREAVTCGILLAQRTGRGVAGVGERRLAGLGQRLVEPLERLDRAGTPRHAPRPGRAPGTRSVPVSRCGIDVDRLDVGRDVLAGAAVPAGQGPHQPPVLVEQVDGQPVDLELAQQRRALDPVAGQARVPALELVVGEGVVEALHALRGGRRR